MKREALHAHLIRLRDLHLKRQSAQLKTRARQHQAPGGQAWRPMQHGELAGFPREFARGAQFLEPRRALLKF